MNDKNNKLIKRGDLLEYYNPGIRPKPPMYIMVAPIRTTLLVIDSDAYKLTVYWTKDQRLATYANSQTWTTRCCTIISRAKKPTTK